MYDLSRIKSEELFNYLKNMENKYGFDEAKINDNTGKKVNFFNLGPNNKWQILLNKLTE